MSEDDASRRFEEIVQGFEREGTADVPWSSGELIRTMRHMEPALKLACDAVNTANSGVAFDRVDLERAVELAPEDFTAWALRNLLPLVDVATVINLNMATVRNHIRRLLSLAE